MHDWMQIAGVLLAGAIAGWFSILTLILSKEKSVSKFRQAWIDSLRSDISSYIAHVMAVSGNIIRLKRTGGLKNSSEPDLPASDQQAEDSRREEILILREFFNENHDDYIGLNKTSKRIQLRLNPNDGEPEARAILDHLKSLDALFNTQKAQTLIAPQIE